LAQAGYLGDVEFCGCKVACSLKICRVEISVAGGSGSFFLSLDMNGVDHTVPPATILIASKQTSMVDTLKIGKREDTCLNRHVSLKQFLTDGHTAGRQSYRVK
jgi:hypothetical protein